MANPIFGKLLFQNATLFRHAMSLYPPLLGAGIRVKKVSRDFREVEVQLRSNAVNGNAFGTHFGGSLYAMVDPFYVLMFVANLGPDYVIWDLAAKIDFERPGRGTVSAKFSLKQDDIDRAIAATAGGEKYTPIYVVDVLDIRGERVATVEKRLYIRLRKPAADGSA
jgi:acyl-coenzyme A thioesterase PaaI-like protein